MKKCPFCAEEIQEAAIFCRYCRRRVKVSIKRIIIFALIIISLVIFAGTHRMQISRTYRNAKISIGEFCVGCREFFNGIRHLPENMKAIARNSKGIESMVNSVTSGSKQGTENSSAGK